MSATYRIVHYTPDPFTGGRFPLGAVVVVDGAVRVAKATHLPLACLADRSTAVAVQRIHARLDMIARADHLPPVFGPYTSLADPCAVPAGVGDAFTWVTGLLNPPHPQRGTSAPHGMTRANLGYMLFVAGKVDRYVRKTFRPESDGGGWLGRYAAGLPQLSHWVNGASDVLLLEPVVPTRPQLTQDLRELAQKLGAYRYAMEASKDTRHSSLIVYVTAGGQPERRAEARTTLAPYANLVVDTDEEAQRNAFLDRIRRTGAEATGQVSLGLES